MDLNFGSDLEDLLRSLHPPWTVDISPAASASGSAHNNPGSSSAASGSPVNVTTNRSIQASKRPSTSIHPINVQAASAAAASLTSASVTPQSTDPASNLKNPSSSPSDSTSFPEMIYVTDELGNILTLKDPETWNVWLSKNCSNVSSARVERSRCPVVVGRNLFEYIADVKVASFTRHIIYMLGSEQQDSFWFCDTPTHERKMIMHVTCHPAFEDSKLIVWASRIIYEQELFVPQSWLFRENFSVPASEVVRSGQTDSGASNRPTINRSVCSYCKRIMVLVSDIDSQLAKALIESSNAMPASMIYDDQIPFLGARGRRGIQPAAATTVPSSTSSLHSSTPLQASVGMNQPSSGSALFSLASMGSREGSTGRSNFSSAAPGSSAINIATSVASDTVVENSSIQLSVQQVVSHLWLSPYQYYYVAKLTDAGACITNSVCEVCYGEIGYLFFRRGTFAGGVRQPVATALGDCIANVHDAEVRRLIDSENSMLTGQSPNRKRKAEAESTNTNGGGGEGGGSRILVSVSGIDVSLPADKRQRGVAPKPARLSMSDVSSGGF
ncbi:hypothetical protein HDU83_001883 [Entophlyctis luteolus]|nr:hypothetical protein HDU83_001883 [Entophlyctis luteolus]